MPRKVGGHDPPGSYGSAAPERERERERGRHTERERDADGGEKLNVGRSLSVVSAYLPRSSLRILPATL